MSLQKQNVEYVFDYIQELCGIALDDTKSYLIEARLGKLVKQYSVNNVTDLVDKAKTVAGEPIRRSLIEAMTTRETFFFRDNSPFEAFQFKALPEMLDVKLRENTRRLRIWSAAASSGQEACSLGIIIHEMIPDLHQWDIQILATDISEEAIDKGRSGVYSTLEVERGLPKHFQQKYFAPHRDGFKVVDSVHRLIRFQQMNLLSPFSFPQPFDIIFCRNVAIYFEKKVKIDLFRRMMKLMPKNGYLFVGVSESLFDCGPEFKPLYHCKSTFYQPNLTVVPASTSPAASSQPAASPASSSMSSLARGATSSAIQPSPRSPSLSESSTASTPPSRSNPSTTNSPSALPPSSKNSPPVPSAPSRIPVPPTPLPKTELRAPHVGLRR